MEEILNIFTEKQHRAPHREQVYKDLWATIYCLDDWLQLTTQKKETFALNYHAIPEKQASQGLQCLCVRGTLKNCNPFEATIVLKTFV